MISYDRIIFIKLMFGAKLKLNNVTVTKTIGINKLYKTFYKLCETL